MAKICCAIQIKLDRVIRFYLNNVTNVCHLTSRSIRHSLSHNTSFCNMHYYDSIQLCVKHMRKAYIDCALGR